MRTIIDLPEEQLQPLAALCDREGISRAEAIRRAVAKMLEEQKKMHNKWQGIEQFFGMWKNREDIGDSVEYIRRLRSEWDREWDEK